MKNRVTMSDIGAALGVSTVTVSKALGGREGVSDAVRDRIIRTAREMGYSFTRLSPEGGEAGGTIVGILTPGRFFDSASFYASMYRELTAEILGSGLLGVPEIVPEDRERDLVPPSVTADRRVNALILMGQFRREYVEMIAGTALPTVLLDFYSDRGEADAVISDGRGGTCLITRYLISLGHRSIAFVGSPGATTSITDRLLGYVRAMLEAGCVPRREWIIPDRDADGRYAFPLALPREMPTAFVCNNDEVAVQVIRQLNALGLDVPGDVSVTGFDDHIAAGFSPVALTTFRADRERMARAAVRCLVKNLRSGREGAVRMEVGGRLILRDSAGPVKIK